MKAAVEGFVAPSATNRKYYETILSTLWPAGHGVPGPLVDEKEIRKAIDKARGKPYVDAFRRMRELQGEEGFKGIIKNGTKYQLTNIIVSEKRVPRTHLNDQDWSAVLEAYHSRCAVCGRTPEDARFQQDHKIPRLRGGGDGYENWQPLCDECNNFKSSSCRDCHLDCKQCSWAYPEFYKPIRIPGNLVKKIREHSQTHGFSPEEFVIEAIQSAINRTN